MWLIIEQLVLTCQAGCCIQYPLLSKEGFFGKSGTPDGIISSYGPFAFKRDNRRTERRASLGRGLEDSSERPEDPYIKDIHPGPGFVAFEIRPPPLPSDAPA